MKISKLTQKTKCDFTGCRNMADVMFQSEDDSKKKMCFCNQCIECMYKQYAKVTTPQSVEAPFKKQKKISK